MPKKMKVVKTVSYILGVLLIALGLIPVPVLSRITPAQAAVSAQSAELQLVPPQGSALLVKPVRAIVSTSCNNDKDCTDAMGTGWEYAGGSGNEKYCTAVAPTCGANAHLDGTTCVCDPGYEGNPLAGCTLIVLTCGANAHQEGPACVCDAGFHDDGAGACVVNVTCTGEHQVVNASGTACVCESGYHDDGAGACVVDTSADLCPNIGGEQTSLPAHMLMDANGYCVCESGWHHTSNYKECEQNPVDPGSASLSVNGSCFTWSGPPGLSHYLAYLCDGSFVYEPSYGGGGDSATVCLGGPISRVDGKGGQQNSTAFGTCPAGPRCGDGQLNQPSEECDGTAGVTEHYTCNSSCHLVYVPYCGDGEVNQANEQCDGSAPAHYTCDACQLTYVPYCGDGVINQPTETCDGTAGVGLHQRCDTCTLINVPWCGDGVVNQTSETCDLGGQNGVLNSGCSKECQNAPVCGNGVKETGEACDLGTLNGQSNSGCDITCGVLPVCGNGITEGQEQCDLGANNGIENSGCSATCTTLPVCGNGIPETGEECDDGDLDNTDGCLQTCKLPTCGDGFVQTGVEYCDDSNSVDGDGCSKCLIEGCINPLAENFNPLASPGNPDAEICDIAEVLLELDPYCSQISGVWQLVWEIQNPNAFNVAAAWSLDGSGGSGSLTPGVNYVGTTNPGPGTHTLNITWSTGSGSLSSALECGESGIIPPPPPPPPTTTRTSTPLIIPVTGLDLVQTLHQVALNLGLALSGVGLALEGISRRKKK